MNERKDMSSFSPKTSNQESGRGPFKSEIGSVTREVLSLSRADLLELKQYLERQRINIRQPMLQTGVVSAGYAKFGAIELGGGKIAFIPNQNNERIVGTPQEFLQALKTLD
jgi:hypothetical protein